MKLLARKGIGVEKRQADVITEQQEDVLWETGILGEDTPQKLLDTLVYLIGLNFALRAGDEHRYLRSGSNSQLQLLMSSNGVKQLKYTEDISKTNRGGLKHRKVERKHVTISSNEENPGRCLVRLYEKYMSLRPVHGKCDAFYLRPLRYTAGKVWFADAAVGIHPLRSTVSRLCKAAGFSGFYTNHSLRATTATRLYDSGVDEQLIAEKTGHKSIAIRSYKRTSKEMADTVDSIVQRKSRRPSASVTGLPVIDAAIFDPPGNQPSTRPTLGPSKGEQAPYTSDRRDFTMKLGDGTTFSVKF
ncbi:uncharacterized protein KIAA1958-like [Haliotis rufescens]|uniref:uncharacterized protein KIAA1958-like n=1 Tax=Haliotis rufescens TaxID=6454 RepID=UPI00201ED819|nr:uncharacterized protein KIAA1958-like [Haliotis rufescens]